MPRNKEQNEEIRRQRKEMIMKGALKVYVEKGYAAAEIGDVAEQAGIARGLVYYYFKDKLTLFRELFLFMFEQSNKQVQMHFERNLPVPVMLESFVRSMYDNLMAQPDSFLFFMRMRHELHQLFTAEELNEWKWHRDNLNMIRETMQRGMDAGDIRSMSPQLLATQYWGAMMHGMMHLRQMNLELQEQGVSKTEIERMFHRDMEDAVASCIALVGPSSREKSSGDDKA
ncbi:TetR/AcrR family transcriptional regulator [Paenibacillus allorhizosphaerae]|uniref:HTH tetR-type domain-containing protein n=1 Tax=Paenibacillus allorhizosphaerae TaxID=2849866 RepID=A0ABN7TGA6_9BACL|nr:TetR/AcrR family transcriptional regulator [Paenibacillus allorhizosphaerae]CAG7617402.1 hypothetical protein PAECIP111802_00404 [Paenibacillus allorhizosphaerae]